MRGKTNEGIAKTCSFRYEFLHTYGCETPKCIFEVSVFELYPKGAEPQADWEYTPVGDPRWRSVLPQDFSNMAAVQQGMKSLGFPGTQPNPYRERSTVNLHYQLSKYMGTGEPRALAKENGR